MRPVARSEGWILTKSQALDAQPDDAIVQVEQVRFAWVRRRMVEIERVDRRRPGRPMGSVFDIWVEDPPRDTPGDSVRPADRIASDSYSAVQQLITYENADR